MEVHRNRQDCDKKSMLKTRADVNDERSIYCRNLIHCLAPMRIKRCASAEVSFWVLGYLSNVQAVALGCEWSDAQHVRTVTRTLHTQRTRSHVG